MSAPRISSARPTAGSSSASCRRWRAASLSRPRPRWRPPPRAHPPRSPRASRARRSSPRARRRRPGARAAGAPRTAPARGCARDPRCARAARAPSSAAKMPRLASRARTRAGGRAPPARCVADGLRGFARSRPPARTRCAAPSTRAAPRWTSPAFGSLRAARGRGPPRAAARRPRRCRPLRTSRLSSASSRASSRPTSSPSGIVAQPHHRELEHRERLRRPREVFLLLHERAEHPAQAGRLGALGERAQLGDLLVGRLDQLGLLGRDPRHDQIAQQLEQRLGQPLRIEPGFAGLSAGGERGRRVGLDARGRDPQQHAPVDQVEHVEHRASSISLPA